MSRVNHHADVTGIPRLAVALYLAGRDYRGGIKALSIDMGMDYDLLQAKLNPAKAQYLNPDELEKFLGLVDNNGLLLSLSRAGAGVAYRPLPMATVGDKYRAMSLLSRNRSELEMLVAAAVDQGWPANSSPEITLQIEKALLELAQGVLGAMHGARACLDPAGTADT
ncbi:TPA: phage regulatory CII family protein [Pseudomonas aeruginosa]